MKLVYKATQQPVAVGDSIIFRDEPHTVHYFRPPHKPSSEGKITITNADGHCFEYYVSVIGAAWIDREDRYHA